MAHKSTSLPCGQDEFDHLNSFFKIERNLDILVKQRFRREIFVLETEALTFGPSCASYYAAIM